jgi:hypothetical protein
MDWTGWIFNHPVLAYPPTKEVLRSAEAETSLFRAIPNQTQDLGEIDP